LADGITSRNSAGAGATAAFARLKRGYETEGALPADRRDAALAALARAVVARQDELVEAVRQDFGHRSPHETKLADLYSTLAGIRHARKNFRRWMKPRRAPIDWMFRPGSGEIRYQPLGVVGILSPWNYPVQLSLGPLAAAVAAGNRVLLKPSEVTPRTSSLLAGLLADVFAPDEVAVALGGPDVAEAVTALKLDHIFFTGSTPVGRHVMKAAAENLTPVTLELGGKSPAIVAPDYPLEKAVASIAGGKLLNAGQTCIAPDYVLLPRGREAEFAEAFRREVGRLYPRLQDNPDYTAIVTDRHYRRLEELVEDARAQGARVEAVNPAGEAIDPARRKLPPTLLLDLPPDSRAMREEIFGPVLPLVPYDRVEDAISFVNARPRPLALYVFSNDTPTADAVLERTLSGGVTLNDTLLHITQEELPFGGVGESGMGSYHGEAGFRTFSHARSVFRQSRLNGAFMMRPPFGPRIERLLGFLVR